MGSARAVDLPLVGVDADHAEAGGVHAHDQREPDVAESHDGGGRRAFADLDRERAQRIDVELARPIAMAWEPRGRAGACKHPGSAA